MTANRVHLARPRPTGSKPLQPCPSTIAPTGVADGAGAFPDVSGAVMRRAVRGPAPIPRAGSRRMPLEAAGRASYPRSLITHRHRFQRGAGIACLRGRRVGSPCVSPPRTGRSPRRGCLPLRLRLGARPRKAAGRRALGTALGALAVRPSRRERGRYAVQALGCGHHAVVRGIDQQPCVSRRWALRGLDGRRSGVGAGLPRTWP